eukprot:954730-Pleurochrysis_carterae.AAC.1
MPPRRTTTNNRRSNNAIFELIEQPPLIACNYVTTTYYTYAKQAGAELTFCVCLESLMACDHCFLLLSCGHSLHTKCFLSQVDTQCPMCRGWSDSEA